MSNDNYNDFLGSLKKGDKIAISGSDVYKPFFIGTVTAVLPTQIHYELDFDDRTYRASRQTGKLVPDIDGRQIDQVTKEIEEANTYGADRYWARYQSDNTLSRLNATQLREVRRYVENCIANNEGI